MWFEFFINQIAPAAYPAFVLQTCPILMQTKSLYFDIQFWSLDIWEIDPFERERKTSESHEKFIQNEKIQKSLQNQKV